MGAGSWGTTLAQILAENGHKVSLWLRDENIAREMQKNRVNKKYLPDFTIHKNITCSASEKKAFAGAEHAVFAIPTSAARQTLRNIAPFIKSDVKFINASKGIENRTFKRTSEIINEELSLDNPISMISGPNIAKEIVKKLPSKSIIACPNLTIAKEWRNLFDNDYFKIYLNTDLVGVELGGALKNIIAIAAGISDGLG